MSIQASTHLNLLIPAPGTVVSPTAKPDCSSTAGCVVGDAASTRTVSYPVGTSSGTKSLEQPLFYAAKWGGFDRFQRQ